MTLNDSGYGHRPPFFRHWEGMIFEIANDCA
jgi:hypothetical protein